MRWDPRQYGKYADERGRPFVEMLARVAVDDAAYVVDLGCGPGPLTAQLAQRWPDAQVIGVDNSSDMIDAAQEHRIDGRLEFICADLREWRPSHAVDVVIANAAFHWVPGHLDLIADIAGWLSPGGALAFQVPDNFGDPQHTLIREILADVAPAGTVALTAAVERPERYLTALVDAGLEPDVWQTTYLHVLPGEDAVLEWVKGTALRPVLTALDDEQCAAFLSRYAAALRTAYPKQAFGTVLPFRRTFAVGLRSREC